MRWEKPEGRLFRCALFYFYQSKGIPILSYNNHCIFKVHIFLVLTPIETSLASMTEFSILLDQVITISIDLVRSGKSKCCIISAEPDNHTYLNQKQLLL